MAISLEGANLVWQRVRMALIGGSVGSKSAALEFKALKEYLATYKGNPKLQFIAIDGTSIASDGGNTASQVLSDSACRLYAIYLVKSGTTACWFKGSNHATTAATDGTQVIAEHDANAVAGNQIVRIFNDGKSFATGLTVTEDTTATGSTQTLKANRFDGFAIIGAP